MAVKQHFSCQWCRKKSSILVYLPYWIVYGRAVVPPGVSGIVIPVAGASATVRPVVAVAEALADTHEGAGLFPSNWFMSYIPEEDPRTP